MTPTCQRGSPSLNPADDIPLSALQHWLFCPRQYALIHIERIWAENRFTAEGRVLHERADSGKSEARPGIKTLRTVEIRSAKHGLSGVADVVELRGGTPYPVEYKRGKPKKHQADEVQLCAQALCLEEMFNCAISEGALFYGKTRRRTIVCIDAALRKMTLQAAADVRACRDQGDLPAPIYSATLCDNCSLFEQCRPKQIGAQRNIEKWMARALNTQGVPA
ncbi:MAG: CRISPR-associated protein Cas4 [Rhodobacteraceae bacterium]|nr:CRISPR-associated protein Cas4 [Paracoccaceae bacterium]